MDLGKELALHFATNQQQDAEEFLSVLIKKTTKMKVWMFKHQIKLHVLKNDKIQTASTLLNKTTKLILSFCIVSIFL